MNNLWTKIKSWFKPKSAKYPKPILTKLQIQSETKPARTVKPFNPKHYKKLIRKFAKQARIIQKNRQRRKYE